MRPRYAITATIAGALFVISSAQAVVTTIDATVTAQVEEFSGGSLLNSDFAFKDLTDTTAALPLVAEARLTQEDSSGEIAGGAARMMFSDPRVSILPDPDEFALDVAAFSTLSAYAYRSRCGSDETREIVFTSTDIGAADGTPLVARSQFFVDGVILLWGELGITDLGGTTAEVTLSVEQTRAGGTAETVLEGGVLLSGLSDGSVSATAIGAISSSNIVVLDLTDTSSDLGPLHMLVIPNLALAYDYEASVGETFTLQARISADVRNSGGTGASVVLGVPILELAAVINAMTGGGAAEQFGELIASALASAPGPAKPLVADQRGTTVTVRRGLSLLPNGCGVLGIEALAPVLLATIVMLVRRR